jgi:flagellar operon protein
MARVTGVDPAAAAQPPGRPTVAARPHSGAFAAALRDSLQAPSAGAPGRATPPGGVRLSRHAGERLAQRGLTLSPAEAGRLERALDEAARRGGRESLVLMDRMALVVSVPNRTVITAVPRGAEPAVFTNIDSAVIA